MNDKCAGMRYNGIMKTIFLLRHAKSDWSDANVADIDRPLSKRGRKAIPRIGRFLAANAGKWSPDVIITSPATRAQKTAHQLARTLNFSGSIRVDEQLYPGRVAGFFAVLRHLPPNVSAPLLVGHNPALEDVAMALMQPETNRTGIIRLPTCGLICLQVELDEWGEISPGSAVLQWFIVPKLLKHILS